MDVTAEHKKIAQLICRGTKRGQREQVLGATHLMRSSFVVVLALLPSTVVAAAATWGPASSVYAAKPSWAQGGWKQSPSSGSWYFFNGQYLSVRGCSR